MPELSRRRLLAAPFPPSAARGRAALRGPAQRTRGTREAQAAAATTHGGDADHARPRRRPRELPRRPHGRPPRQRLRPARDPARLRLGHDHAGSPSGRVVREWELVAADKEIEVAPGVALRRLDLQRPHPGPDAALPRGRAAADHVRQRLRRTRTRSTSTASTRPRWTACPASAPARSRPGGARSTSSTRCRPGCTSTTATSGRWPSTSPRASTARSSSTPQDGREDADEMVMVMNGFDTNFDRANEVYAANTIGFAYMDKPIVAQARRARPRLPRQRPRVRPHQLVPPAREPVRLLPDGDAARRRPSSPTR